MSNYKFFEEHNYKAVQSIKNKYAAKISLLGEDGLVMELLKLISPDLS